MDLKKSTLRLASTLLAAVMLAQCVPMNAFAEGGADLEKPELEPTEGYEVRAPFETEHMIQAEIPPTFTEIPDKEEDSLTGTAFSYAAETDPLNEPASFDATTAVQYLRIMLSDDSYSFLTEAERKILCDYSGISDDRFLAAEQLNLSLRKSVFYIRLASICGLDLEYIAEIAPNESNAVQVLREVALLREMIGDRGIPEKQYKTMINDILSGSNAEQMQGALSKYEEKNPAEATGNTSLRSGNNSDLEEISDGTFLGAPYKYNQSADDRVVLNSGALEYTHTDYVLPGVNGLDLVIKRIYNSQDAGIYAPDVNYEEETIYLVGYYTCSYWKRNDGTETIIDENTDVSYRRFETESSALNWMENWCAQSYTRQETIDGVSYTYYKNYFASGPQAQTRQIPYTSKKENDYLLRLYGLGHGWRFGFSSIDCRGNDNYRLLLADGTTYSVKKEENTYVIDGYKLSALRFYKEVTTIPETNALAFFTLRYKDGTTEYFDNNGMLIYKADRCGNRIIFERLNSWFSHYPTIRITDTLDRITTIACTQTNLGKTITVTLPDNTVLLYSVEESDNGGEALSSFVDAVGNITYYGYTIQNAKFDLFPYSHPHPQTNQYINLTTITHPTLSQTVFNYQKFERGVGQPYFDCYKVVNRKDSYNQTDWNEFEYQYTVHVDENTSWPWPEDWPWPYQANWTNNYPWTGWGSNIEYYTTVETGERIEHHCFDDEHLLLFSTVSDQSLGVQETKYTYDSYDLPSVIQTYSFNANGDCNESVIRRTNNSKGDILNEWSPLATDETDTINQTIYEYYSDYALPKSMTFQPTEDITVKSEYTLTSDNKNIAEERILVNQILKRRTTYTYDAYGNVLTSRQYNSGGEDVLTQYTYQDNAYLASRSVSNGTDTPVTELSCTYDLMGRLIAATDANGNTSTYSYDALGNITQVTNPDLSTVSYNRNYTGNYVTVTNELGDAVKYTYTPLGLEYETVDVSTGRVLLRKEYDSSSRLETVSDFVYGAITTYTYDALDRITSVTVEDGDHSVLSQEAYVYDDAAENGQYQKITKTVFGDSDAPDIVTTEYRDKKGRTVKTGRFLNGTEYFDVFTYDTTDQVLTALTAADAAKGLLYSEKYEYDGLGQPVRVYNGAGQYAEAQYDMLGRKTAAWDYSGTPTLFEYDVQGRLTRQTVTIAAGQTAVSEYEYDNAGNLILERTPANDVSGWNEAAYTYDSRNRLTAATQYDGSAAAAVTTYTYDAAGNLLTMTAGGHTTAYTYDRFANLLSMTDPMGQSETYSYSALGKLESKTDRNNITTSFAYDAAGRIVSIQAGTGTDADVVNYTYTASGQVARAENNWQITEYEYDGFGRVIAVYEGDKTGIPATSVTIELDANGGTVLPAQIIRTVGEPYDLPTPTWFGHFFDGWYLEETLIESDDLVTTSQRHTLTAHWITLEDTVTLDPCGGTVSPTVVMSQYGVPLELPTPVWTGHDFLGWYLGDLLVEDGDPSPITEDCTLYAYWSDTYRVILDLDDGSTPQLIIVETDNAVLTLPTLTRTGYTFDGWYEGETLVSMGGEIQITDDLTLTAHWTANTYTVQYRGQSSLHALLPDVTYSTQLCTYDVPFTMPGRPQNAFVAGKTFAGWSYTRGASTPDFLPEQEDVVNLTDEDEGVVELWAVWRSSWSGGGRFGMQSSAADPEPAVAFHTKTYTYDLAGNRTYFELSKDGETIQSVGYAYDTLNRLTAVTEGGVTQASYTYDVNGNRSGMTLTNGVSTAYTYNAANWITSLTNTQNGNTLSSFDYTYYPSGNQASKTDQNGVVTTYQYDGLGRLTCESEQGGLTVNYAFDAAGNRASMAVTGTENYTVNYNYDANNRLISSLYTGSTTQSSYYTYDACGNLLTAAEWRPQEAVASAANYGYNGFNQLATQTVNDVTSSFAYNADGIRTAKLTGNVLTGYLLDGGNVVAELEEDAPSASYLRGANLISRTTTATEYYTFNAHGDVVGLVNNAGTQTKTYDYDAFGNEKDRIGADPNPFRYCGEYFDVESGAYYLRARYYDPSIGRFTQEDTHWNASNMIYGDEPQQIGEYEDPLGTSRYVYAPQITAVMQAGNLYGYGLGNPIRHFDPSGEIAITTIILIGSAVVGLIAAGAEAHQSKKHTGKIDWENTVVTGVSWFFIAASLGLTAYEVYLSYCAYTGQTPVTEVNFNGNNTLTHNGGSQLVKPYWVKKDSDFVSWVRESFQKTKMQLDLSQTKQLVGWANELGVKIEVNSGHPGSEWPMPHLHLGDIRVHVAITEEAYKWLIEYLKTILG